MAVGCVDTSNRLRKFLFSGQEMDWTVRRDVATAANLLVDLSIELERGKQSNNNIAELVDNTTAFVRGRPRMIHRRSG